MTRERLLVVVAAVSLVLSAAVQASAQGAREDYARAQQFLPDEIKRLAFDGQVDPHWLAGRSRFWYMKDAFDRKEFLIVDAAQGTRAPAFDHQRLAAGLSAVAGRRYDAAMLPFSYLQFADEGKAVAFAVEGTGFRCELTTYQCAKTTDVVDESDEEIRVGPPRPPDPTRLPRTERLSPDRKFAASVRDHNLWVRNTATGEQIQLSHDGAHFYDYATPLPSPTLMVAQGSEDVVQAPAVFWSPDSKKIAT